MWMRENMCKGGVQCERKNYEGKKTRECKSIFFFEGTIGG